MLEYIKEIIKEGESGVPSSKRLVLVTSTMFMGIGMTILTIAACIGRDVADAIWAFTIPLSGMAGVTFSSVEIARLRNRTDEKLTTDNQIINE